MKFSIIVPIYKVEEYLTTCVDSILMQDFKDFEVILVDDGSPDRCPEICDDYALKDDRVIVIHKENGGLSDARNVGIKIASGDYLCFLDSDDYWDSTSALKKINETIEIHNPDIIQLWDKKYFCKDKRLAPAPQKSLEKYNGSKTKELINNLVATENLAIAAWAMIVSRSFILNNNLYFKKGIKSEDLEWAMRLFCCEPIWAFIDEVFYVYRTQRSNSITSSVDYKHICDYCYILEDSIKLLEKTKDEIKNALLSYLMYHALIACALCYNAKLSFTQRKDVLTKLKKICTNRIDVYCSIPKVQLANKIYKLLGFSIMAKAVGFYLKYRKK